MGKDFNQESVNIENDVTSQKLTSIDAVIWISDNIQLNRLGTHDLFLKLVSEYNSNKLQFVILNPDILAQFV